MLCLYGLSSGDQDKNDSGDLETLSSFFVMNFVGFSVCVDLNQEQEAVVHSAASLSDSLFQMLSSTQTTLIIITALPGLALQRLAASGGWLALQTAVSSGEEGSAHETQQQLSVRGSADELFLDWSAHMTRWNLSPPGSREEEDEGGGGQSWCNSSFRMTLKLQDLPCDRQEPPQGGAGGLKER